MGAAEKVIFITIVLKVNKRINFKNSLSIVDCGVNDTLRKETDYIEVAN